MNDDRSLERAARSWIEEGPTRAPDRPVDAALRTIESTAQERDLRIPWRLPSLNPMNRVAMMAVAVVVVGTAVFALRPSSNIGGPPSPSPTVVPTRSGPPGPPTRPPNLFTQPPLVPASPLPNPSGNPLTVDLIGRTYQANPPEIQGTQLLVLTLRAADDPQCAAMFEGRSTCFTYMWTPNYPKHITDPGARGAATIIDGRLVLSFDLIPFGEDCTGEKATYTIASAGATLAGVSPPACTVPGFTEIPNPLG
jgi:hypothetical protein